MTKEEIYPINGYAPGNYSCSCTFCKSDFIGDKRAVTCKSCALELAYYFLTTENTRLMEALEGMQAMILRNISVDPVMTDLLIIIQDLQALSPEHKCKYCGAMTTQPDEQCYKAPNNSALNPEGNGE